MILTLNKQLDPGWISHKQSQGLYPQSGDWYYPDRWVVKEDFIAAMEEKGQGDWARQEGRTGRRREWW